MLQKVRTFCRQQRLLEKQDTVIVGISGGADSVCLLSMCKEMQREYHLHIEAVHVNHMLRGAAAEADAAFSQKLCAQLEIPCTVYAVPVAKLAKEWGMSEEDAGRRVRYALFAAHACTDSAKIAVAHQMDDQAETMLLHLVRGSGLHGLAGMQPVRVVSEAECWRFLQMADTLRPLLQAEGTEATDTLRPLLQAEGTAAADTLHPLLQAEGTAAADTLHPFLQAEAAVTPNREQNAKANQPRPALHIIRPLLCMTRQEICAYLQERGLPFCEDASNREDAYTRNKIRHHVLSYIKEEINPAAVQSMCRNAALLWQADDFLQQTAKTVVRQCVSVTEDGQLRMELAQLLAQHEAVQGYMLRQCLERITDISTCEASAGDESAGEAPVCHDSGGANGGGLQNPLHNVTQQHIADICRLAQGQTGKRLCLPGGLSVCKTYDALLFAVRRDVAPEYSFLPQIQVDVPGTYVCEETGETFVFTKKSYEKEEKIPNSSYTKWFDYDKIKHQLRLRGRMEGDYLTVNAAGGTKKLKRYLIESKCPADMRDRLLLLADGSHIMWIPDYRISEAYKITEHTRVVLVVTRTSGKDTKDE